MKKIMMIQMVACLLSLFPVLAHADNITSVTVSANSIRLENYSSGPNGNSLGVAIWGIPGSPCGGGNVSTANMSANDQDRLFAMLTAAKIANRTMFFRYNPSNGCQIASFGMDN